MTRWRFNATNPVRETLEQMLQAAAHQPAPNRGDPMPINVHQSDSDLFIEAALPGVQPDDIDISYHDGLLTLRAHSEVPETEYFHQEIRSIAYLRQVMLPVECRYEQAEASLENGILRIRIPKQQPRAPEKIHIQVNRSSVPATIEATRGEGYREVKAAEPKPKPKPRAAGKKPSGAAAEARKASPGSRPGPSR